MNIFAKVSAPPSRQVGLDRGTQISIDFKFAASERIFLERSGLKGRFFTAFALAPSNAVCGFKGYARKQTRFHQSRQLQLKGDRDQCELEYVVTKGKDPQRLWDFALALREEHANVEVTLAEYKDRLTLKRSI